MIEVCDECHAERGPWERRPCPVLMTKRGWRVTVPDLAVAVLEHSDGPLNIYDMARSIRRDFKREVNDDTLQVSISNDPRFCWAGKGLYGLYRHGFVAGPRSLAGIARVYLYSHGPLTHPALEFVLKRVGYRFQGASLNQALNYDGAVFWFNQDRNWYWDTARTPEAAVALLRLGVASSADELEQVVGRCAVAVASGLHEYKRRVSS